MSEPADDEPVPKLPYGRGLKLDKAMIFRIVATLILLVLIVVAARPCANATSKFVTDFDDKGSASATMPKPGNVDKLGSDYEYVGPNATKEEGEAAWERAKARAREKAGSSAGSGSAGSGSAGSGSASRAGSGSAGSGSAGSGTGSGSAGSGSAVGSGAPPTL